MKGIAGRYPEVLCDVCRPEDEGGGVTKTIAITIIFITYYVRKKNDLSVPGSHERGRLGTEVRQGGV